MLGLLGLFIIRVQKSGVEYLYTQFFILLTTVEQAEAYTAEDLDQQAFSNSFIRRCDETWSCWQCSYLQVEEDCSPLPPPKKRRISQASVLEEQHKALKLQQEMLELKKTKLGMEIRLLSKKLDDSDKENILNWI